MSPGAHPHRGVHNSRHRPCSCVVTEGSGCLGCSGQVQVPELCAEATLHDKTPHPQSPRSKAAGGALRQMSAVGPLIGVIRVSVFSLPVFPLFVYSELVLISKKKYSDIQKKIRGDLSLRASGVGGVQEGRWGGGAAPPWRALTLCFPLQLGEQLKQLVPASGLTVMDLEAEGVCVRFSPLMTAAGNWSRSSPSLLLHLLHPGT